LDRSILLGELLHGRKILGQSSFIASQSHPTRKTGKLGSAAANHLALFSNPCPDDNAKQRNATQPINYLRQEDLAPPATTFSPTTTTI
jgi:hypothetical protein